MKKALSVLLVAAALFGFYGSAVTVNDLLACKDYWEEAGEKSTADMNKLEDGLNQLKENEQAYLDGKDQLAEGEAALADGEAELAKGEAKLANGEAQYAKGLADYAAAPAKLAAGEKKLAAGKKELASGEDSYKQLNTLIGGLKTAKKHGTKSTKKHDTYWHDAFSNALKPGRQLIVKTLNDKKDMVAMLESLTGAKDLVSKASNAKGYKQFASVVDKELEPSFRNAAKALKGFAKLAADKADELQTASDAHAGLLNLEGQWEDPNPALPGGVSMKTAFGALNAKNEETAVDTIGGPLAALKPAFKGMSDSPAYGAYPASALLRGGVAKQLSDFLGEYGETLEGVAASNSDFAQLLGAMKVLATEGGAPEAQFKAYMPAVISGLNDKAVPALKEYAKTAEDSADQFKTWHEGYETLHDGKNKQLGSTSEGIPYAFKNMITNPTIKAAIKKYDKGLMKELKKYSGNKLKTEGFVEFDGDLTHICNDIIPRALNVLSKVKSSAGKQLAAGRKQLAAGKAELAKGKRDYAAAPGKLADARKQLADGRAQLAAGRQQLADGRQALEDGRQQLADGRAKLAEYEDGEQQVRDGLATLVGTEPDLDLVGILDRLEGDGDFDNGDDHLDIDEGLNAVEVGRGYQADDGVLITNEIMARAVGTGALLGAGVLAVLAALLSFLKKNKGAGVFALLSAAAGAFGAFYGTNAGTYFSDIAGSTAGSTAWVAAGILGAIALVHAAVHFASKKTVA